MKELVEAVDAEEVVENVISGTDTNVSSEVENAISILAQKVQKVFTSCNGDRLFCESKDGLRCEDFDDEASIDSMCNKTDVDGVFAYDVCRECDVCKDVITNITEFFCEEDVTGFECERYGRESNRHCRRPKTNQTTNQNQTAYRVCPE